MLNARRVPLYLFSSPYLFIIKVRRASKILRSYLVINGHESARKDRKTLLLTYSGRIKYSGSLDFADPNGKKSPSRRSSQFEEMQSALVDIFDMILAHSASISV
jgi:hypothetical protein